MIQTESVAPPKRSSRKVRWIGAILFALLLVLDLIGWIASRTGNGTHYQLVTPGRGGSGRIGPIPVDAAPDLMTEGVAVEFLHQAAQIHQIAFIRRDRYLVGVQITAGQQRIDELSYALIGPDGEEVSTGKIKLDASLEPEEKGTGMIEDSSIPKASRIVICR